MMEESSRPGTCRSNVGCEAIDEPERLLIAFAMGTGLRRGVFARKGADRCGEPAGGAGGKAIVALDIGNDGKVADVLDPEVDGIKTLENNATFYLEEFLLSLTDPRVKDPAALAPWIAEDSALTITSTSVEPVCDTVIERAADMNLHTKGFRWVATGAIVDGDANQPGLQFDGRLAYDAGDVNAGKTPALVAAGYTYNKDNDKLTTNYALDGRLGILVHQGSKEGQQPVVSPNTGRLYTVGSLGIGPFQHATLDISDLSNTAYAAITQDGRSVWYRIDLATGRATRLGTIAGGPVVGTAIEP